jgi:PIN domain nuclease of toxin-antitoxin system
MTEGDDRRLSAAVIARIEEAAREGRVLVHPMSVWEVGTLVRKGRIRFTVPLEDWISRALALPGIFLLDLSPRSALESALLSSNDLSDPVDRMLVAAARLEDAFLVTADRRILEHGEAQGVRILPAC